MTRSAATRRAVVLILTWIGGSIGHEGGDYLIQRDVDAQRKQHRTTTGRWALLSHCASYAATQALAKHVIYRAAGERVPLHAQIVGGLTEALVHGLIDDGRPLKAFAGAVGKQRFHDLAADGLNGRALLDQASHKFLQIPLGAIVTTLLSARADHRRGMPQPAVANA